MGDALAWGQNLNHYKYFVAVMRAGTVSQAAIMLGVRQSTVSYSIACLERELGEELFIPGRHGILPLRRAKLLYQALDPIAHAFERTVHAFCRG